MIILIILIIDYLFPHSAFSTLRTPRFPPDLLFAISEQVAQAKQLDITPQLTMHFDGFPGHVLLIY